MRIVAQRVGYCKVIIDSETYSEISNGLLCYIGASKNDTEEDMKWTIEKAINLRIFEDENGKLNLSLKDVEGELMLVSQFTLYGSVKKGKRPSFTEAASIEDGRRLYSSAVEYAKSIFDEDKVKTGSYQAMMNVEYSNLGPVTIIIDSEKNF
ncbi:MAG: D-aminoacyl-tRNA deacylase [Spirochaetota bacterium]